MAKTPVIASRAGGIPELVKDGVNGLLFEPGDVQDLKKKIEYVIDNPALLDKLRQDMPVVKGIEENAGEMEEIYSGLITGRKS